jgi:hypothetical protein
MTTHLQRAIAIDAYLAALDQPGGKRPRLYQSRAPQPFVEPLAFHAMP